MLNNFPPTYLFSEPLFLLIENFFACQNLLVDLALHPDQAPLAPLVEAGLLSTRAGRLAATAAGRLVLDRVIAELVTGADPGF